MSSSAPFVILSAAKDLSSRRFFAALRMTTRGLDRGLLSIMDRQSEQPDHVPDPLDRLLAAAHWVEPNPTSVERLRSQWRSQVAKRLRRRRRAFAWAAAAVFVLVAIGLAVFVRGDCRSPCPQSHDIAANVPGSPATTPVVSPLPPNQTPAAASHAASTRATDKATRASRLRPTNANDRAALAARRRAQRDRKRRTASEPAEAFSQRSPVDRAIEELADHPDRDALKTAEPLLTDRERSEEALTSQIGRLTGPQQAAAIRLLAAVATPRSLGLLGDAASLPETHVDVVRALARLSDAPNAARLAQNGGDSALRQELLGILLTRGDGPSVRAYLGCVDDAETSGDCAGLPRRSARPPGAGSAPIPTQSTSRRTHRRGRRLGPAQSAGGFPGVDRDDRPRFVPPGGDDRPVVEFGRNRTGVFGRCRAEPAPFGHVVERRTSISTSLPRRFPPCDVPRIKLTVSRLGVYWGFAC